MFSAVLTPHGTAQGQQLQPVRSGEVESRALSPVSTPTRRRPPFRPVIRQECSQLGLGLLVTCAVNVHNTAQPPVPMPQPLG